jgi:hypothetical protein
MILVLLLVLGCEQQSPGTKRQCTAPASSQACPNCSPVAKDAEEIRVKPRDEPAAEEVKGQSKE